MTRALVLWMAAGALVSFSVSAQWVKLDPCGFKKGSEGVYGIPKGPAPNIGPIWVWVPHVVSIIEIKEHESHKARCSQVIFVQGQMTIVGSGEEIHRRLVGR